MTVTRVHFHHSLFQWWGVPARYVQLTAHLDRARFAVTTSGIPDVYDPSRLPDWQQKIDALAEPAFRRRLAPWYTLGDLAAEAETLARCRDGQIDIVHFMDGEHSGPFLPRLARRGSLDIRTVATYHQPPDLAVEVTDVGGLRHLDAVVLMAPSQQPFFQRFLPPERIHVLLHGVDTTFFTPSETRRPRGPLRCITTGLHLRDWDAFYAVAATLPEVRFTVVTSGRLGLREDANVPVLSGIEDAELAKAYRAADVLFLPVKDATANNSLLEGMASGLAVVSTDLEAVRAYVPTEAGFLIAGNALQPCVEALTALAGNSRLRSRMAQAARRRACELAWSATVTEYEAHYDRLVAMPRRAPAAIAGPLPAMARPEIDAALPVRTGQPPATIP